MRRIGGRLSLAASVASSIAAISGLAGLSFVQLEVLCTAALGLWVMWWLIRLTPEKPYAAPLGPLPPRNRYPILRAIGGSLIIVCIVAVAYFILAYLQYGRFTIQFSADPLSVGDRGRLTLDIEEWKPSLFGNTYRVELSIPNIVQLSDTESARSVVHGKGKPHELLPVTWSIDAISTGVGQTTVVVRRGWKRREASVNLNVSPRQPPFEVADIRHRTDLQDDYWTTWVAVPVHAREDCEVFGATIEVFASFSRDIMSVSSGSPAVASPSLIRTHSVTNLEQLDIDAAVMTTDREQAYTPLAEDVSPLEQPIERVEKNQYLTLLYEIKQRDMWHVVRLSFKVHPVGESAERTRWESGYWYLGGRLSEPIDMDQWVKDVRALPEAIEDILARHPYAQMHQDHGVLWLAEKFVTTWVALLKTDEYSNAQLAFEDMVGRLDTNSEQMIDAGPESAYLYFVLGSLDRIRPSVMHVLSSESIDEAIRFRVLSLATVSQRIEIAKELRRDEYQLFASLLARDEDTEVRKQLAHSRHAPLDVLRQLAEGDPDESVRAEAQEQLRRRAESEPRSGEDNNR